ncbi:MAG: hypothetical protein JSV19_10270 [Phycisphaerales bacterium]|nr:MAG: hypothetical protein JSV19_10270 [Phycisphaerales bacterium]
MCMRLIRCGRLLVPGMVVCLMPIACAPTAETPVSRRDNIRPYPVDYRNFSPVDRWLASAPPVVDDAEGSLNPYVLHVIQAYPTDGSYPYHCDFVKKEYDIYNGVTQDLWYQGRVVAKAYPDGSRCSYCCGLTFELLVRAMKLRNEQAGLPIDDFNGMDFYDLFNLLQLWYIEGKGDSPQRGIVAYGLGEAIKDFEQARPGDFCDFSRNNKSGHSVVFIDWVRDDAGRITGMKYFSSNSGGVGYITEYFSDSGGKLLRNWVRLARVGAIEDYKPFDRKAIPRRKAYAP